MMETKTKSQLTDEFLKEFLETKNNITKDIENLSSEGDTNLNDKLNFTSSQIKDLAKKLHKATSFLPPYTTKIRQNELRVLEDLLKKKETLLNPRQKFSFKTKLHIPVPSCDKTNTSSEKLNDEAKKVHDKAKIDAQQSALEQRTNDPNFLTIQEDTVEMNSNDVITFEENQLNKIDVMVRNLKDKKIILNGSPSTLHVSNLTNCKLLCGPVQTSVFIDNCTKSTLFLCCQQLRTHNSSELDIYLRVSSRGIIENSTKIRFAPYSWDHPKSSEFHKLANIDENLENYAAIDDFHWLAFSTPSPNWSILPENERSTF